MKKGALCEPSHPDGMRWGILRILFFSIFCGSAVSNKWELGYLEDWNGTEFSRKSETQSLSGGLDCYGVVGFVGLRNSLIHMCTIAYLHRINQKVLKLIIIIIVFIKFFSFHFTSLNF